MSRPRLPEMSYSPIWGLRSRRSVAPAGGSIDVGFDGRRQLAELDKPSAYRQARVVQGEGGAGVETNPVRLENRRRLPLVHIVIPFLILVAVARPRRHQLAQLLGGLPLVDEEQ